MSNNYGAKIVIPIDIDEIERQIKPWVDIFKQCLENGQETIEKIAFDVLSKQELP